MNPTLRIEQRDGQLILSGELDHVGVCSALRESREWFANGDALKLDLSGVTRCESAGVALLVEWWRQARQQGQTIEFLNPPEQMRSLLKFFALERMLPIRA